MRNAGENDSEMIDHIQVEERDPGARETVGVLAFDLYHVPYDDAEDQTGGSWQRL